MQKQRLDTSGEQVTQPAMRPGVWRILPLILLLAAVQGCGSDDDDDDDEPDPPKIAGIWSGTWEGIDSAFGPAAGTWESHISQRGSDVRGPISLGGDIDCAEGKMTGTADAEQERVSGTITRDPCPSNSWEFTAFNQDEFNASGVWEKPGLSLGSFQGQRIATFTGPYIRYVYPSGAGPNDYVTIVGQRLDMDPVNDSLSLGPEGSLLIPESVSESVISLRLPGVLPESDQLVLKTGDGRALSPKAFNTEVTSPNIGSTQDIALAEPGMMPASVTFSSNGRRAFIANPGRGTVSMINAEFGEEFTSTLVLPGPSVPVSIHAVVADPGGRHLYAAGDNLVGILHAHTLQSIRNLDVPASGSTVPNPQGIAVSPDGRWLLVSEAVAGGRVTIIDTQNDYAIADTLFMAAGNTPRGIAASPDNRHAYIAVSGDDNAIWAYDLVTATVDSMIAAGVSPAAIAVTADANRLYVVNAPADTLNHYDLDTGGSGEIDLGAGVAPASIAITPDGYNLFVSSNDNSIRVIDVLSNGVTPIDVGGASTGVAISPDGKRAYATLPGLNKVVEIGNQRTLRISRQGGGIGSIVSTPGGIQCGSTCIASFDHGEVVRLQAIPDTGSNSRFDYWSGDPGCGSSFMMNANRFCVAHFSVYTPPSSSSGSSDCFIATAAYGSWLDPHVVTLRHFRDEYLLTNAAGAWLVEFYYASSPPIADYIRERETLRAAVRGVLAAIIFSIEYPSAAGFGLLLSLLLMLRVRQARRLTGRARIVAG